MGTKTQVNVKNVLTFSQHLSNLLSFPPPASSLISSTPPKQKQERAKRRRQEEEKKKSRWVSVEMSPNAAHRRL